MPRVITIAEIMVYWSVSHILTKDSRMSACFKARLRPILLADYLLLILRPGT